MASPFATEPLGVKPSQGDLDETIQSCMDEMKLLNKHLSALRRQRNALSPVCCLPDELLGEIFCDFVIRPLGFKDTNPEAFIWPRPWLTITHVCQHWRSVAIGHRRLWANINFAVPSRLVTVFAQRAGDCPLRLSIASGRTPAREGSARRASRQGPDLIDFLVEHVHRIGSLQTLTLSSGGFSTLASRLGENFCFTNLGSLSFQQLDNSNNPLLAFQPTALPKLTRLTCTYVPPSFIDSLSALKLTSLVVRSPHGRLSAGAWLRILQGLPSLSALTLSDVFTRARSPADTLPLEGIATVHFPHLQTLILEDRSTEYTLLQFFARCCISPSTNVDIDLGGDIDDDNAVHVMSLLASVAAGNAPNQLSMPPFITCDINSEGFNLWTTEVDVADPKPWTSVYRPPYPTPTWTLSFHFSMEECLVHAFFTAFSFCPLRVLAVNSQRSFVEHGTVLQLRSFPTIHKLSIGGREALEALIACHGVDGWSTETMLMPNLELLVLRNVAWKVHVRPKLQSLELSLGYELAGMLRTRNNYVAPIQTLKLVGSVNLADWTPLTLEEEGVVGKVENSKPGSAYHCPCNECIIYGILNNEEEGLAV